MENTSVEVLYEAIVQKHTKYSTVKPIPPERLIYYIFTIDGHEREFKELLAINRLELLSDYPYRIVWRLSEEPENLLWEGRDAEALERVERHIQHVKEQKKRASQNGDWFSGPQWGDWDERDLQHYIKLRAGIRGGKRTNWQAVAEELRDHFAHHVQTTQKSLGAAREAIRFQADPTVQRVRDSIGNLENSLFEAPAPEPHRKTVTRKRGKWIYEYELLGYEYDSSRGRTNPKIGRQVSKRPVIAG